MSVKPLFFLVCILLFVVNVSATRTKITDGYILISGSEYKTGNYQTYLEFDLKGTRQNPRITYNFVGQQDFSVYQDHPIQPEGSYIFSVKMPYSPNSIFINNVFVSPTWYSNSTWEITSSALTPTVGKDSPEFVNVEENFQFVGRMLIYGTASVTTRARGSGTSDLLFQNVGGRYFLRRATYIFGENNKTLVNLK